MDPKKVKIYAACDRAIQNLNRDSLKEFGQLKLADWDEIHVIRTVNTAYRRLKKKARAQFYEVAFESYLMGLTLCDIPRAEAYRMAEKAITGDWVDRMMSEVDPITGYRFDSETDRKAARLAETLEVSSQRNAEIDKALRYWSRQCGQFCINYTDWAILKAYRDAGIRKVMWVTQRDERVCEDCAPLNGVVFEIDEVPPKPHIGCRCELWPVRE